MINQSFAMDEKRTKHLGKFFNTIDFEFSDEPTVSLFERFKGDTPVGKFFIGGKEFQLTIDEILQIKNTMSQCETVFTQRYRMGFYGKR